PSPDVMCNFMRTVTIIFAFFFILPICAQETGKEYFFKEIGWTITLPQDFKTLDSSENERINKRGLKAIEESNEITADIIQLKTLIAASKDVYNYFNSTIRRFDPDKEG